MLYLLWYFQNNVDHIEYLKPEDFPTYPAGTWTGHHFREGKRIHADILPNWPLDTMQI